MPGTFRYALDRFTWDGSAMGGNGSHVPPSGSVSVLDLRNDSDCAQRSQSTGYGLFAWAAGATLPGSAIPLGDGYLSQIVPSGTTINTIKTALGITGTLGGATLADVFLDGVLGDNADPTGVSGPRPIDFTTELDRELWLANHSRVAFKRYDPARIFAANPKGVDSHLRDMLRDQVRKADKISPAHAEKVMGALLMKCGVSRAEVKAGGANKKSEIAKLCPPEWSPAKKSAMKTREPLTQLVELWPTNGAITSGQTHTWAEETSMPWVAGAAVSGGLLGNTSNGTSFHGCRCTTALSSADHWAQGNIRVNGNYQAHLLTRMASGAASCYVGGFYSDGSLNAHFVSKYVAGTGTTLAAGTNIAPMKLPTATLGKTRSNGSTQSFELAGFATLSVTDTSVTGNLYFGAGTSDQLNNHTNYVGSVTGDDGLSAAPVADFSGTPLTGSAPLSVAFTDASTNTPTSWLWEKSSDGGSSWSNFASGATSQNPTESFAAGTWAVRLTATNSGGSDSETKLAYVVATGGGHAIAGQYGLGIKCTLGL